jgi:tetratricopeptide (TPR) repeat protein
MENLKLLIQLYYRPAAAMSDIIDQGSWVFAAVAMLVVLFVFHATVNSGVVEHYQVQKFDYSLSDYAADGTGPDGFVESQIPEAAAQRPQFPLVGRKVLYFISFEDLFISPLVSLLLFFVPALLVLARVSGAGYAGTNAQNNYLPLATCAMMAWTAAHLPFAVAGMLLSMQDLSGETYIAFWLLSGLLFGVLMVFAVRTVLGMNYGAAVAIVAVAAFAFPLGMYVFRYVSPFLFSPFLIIMAVVYFGGFLRSEANGFGNSFRQRQNFKRYLQSSTINPRDADAHIQLALIYLQRHQQDKALEHFNKAFEIDPQEIDANYELGRIAREKGAFQTALNHFGVVVEQNDKHKSSEIWREIGATYMAARMYSEAIPPLETYNSRHPYDTEGLYYLGKTFLGLGKIDKARDFFLEAVESAKNAPRHRRREIAYWGKLAQKEL